MAVARCIRHAPSARSDRDRTLRRPLVHQSRRRRQPLDRRPHQAPRIPVACRRTCAGSPHLQGRGSSFAAGDRAHALPARRRFLRPGADRRQPLAPSSHDGPGRSIPDSPDHGAMQGAPLLRQDHAMKSVCERTAAGGIRGGRARSHSTRTTLCDARVTYRRARLGRARLCPMESHLIPLIPVNPT